MLAEKGTELGGPWSDHLDRSGNCGQASRCCGEGNSLVYCRRDHAQKTCERDHRGPATETYERQV